MNVIGKTAYVDFMAPISGVETAIRIFETETHLFVYVNQHPAEMHLYNELLRADIQSGYKQLNHKEVTVICNLANHDALALVKKRILEILNE
ncbi:hypothetical protein PAEPH01_0782 [Pancytospora epiphaga]|nr:hypothetical protein PAEPH01_0782 [Pancytospora epiphaga]